MQMYLDVQGEEVWDDVENGSCISKTAINKVEHVKVKWSLNEDD